MSNKESDWKREIVDALGREQSTIPGRSGETPIGNLALELSQLSNQQERNAAIMALNELVKNPDSKLEECNSNGYWQGLSFLTKHFTGVEKEKLIFAFREKLFGKEMQKKEWRVYVLHGFIAASGRLTPKDLDQLAEIKEQAPLAWLGAAARSSLFTFTRKNTIELLEKERIDLSTFLMGMDAWRKSWDSREDFDGLMRQFREAVPDDKGKAKFTRWLKRRGYEEKITESISPAKEILPSLPIDDFMTTLRRASPYYELA